MRRPYYVYIGLQDNGSWGGPSATRSANGILNSDWFGIGGGDGFQTAVDPTDYNIVYTESQDGNTNRYDLRDGRVQSIRPRASARRPRRTRRRRWGGARRGAAGRTCSTRPRPISTASTGTRRSSSRRTTRASSGSAATGCSSRYNRGDTWTASADLTRQIDRNTVAVMGVPGNRTMLSKNDGVVAYSTIISLSESPVMPGVVWAGTDDGNVQVSRDGGMTFTEVGKNMPGLPANHLYWISRIDASHFDAATAYVSVDGHRSNDLKPYLFVTRDYGQTWQSIAGNLPQFGIHPGGARGSAQQGSALRRHRVRPVRVDRRRQDLEQFMNNLPTARVDDILVHPRDNDLIVATHARGVWIADDMTALQQATPRRARRTRCCSTSVPPCCG